jgi:hypothetical protein
MLGESPGWTASPAQEASMAKGQKRSGREPKKPKSDKKSAPATKVSFVKPASASPPGKPAAK